MTDKHIIIDGVDVSRCEYYDKNKPLLTCTCEEYACSECHNCYYKQLKRKEQECEELKDLANHNGRVCNERLDKIDKLEHEINELNGQLDQLKSKNEDLQKQLNNTVMQKCPQCGEVYLNPVGCELHEENQQLKAYNKQLEKENLHYRNQFAMQYMSITVDGKEVYCGFVKRLEKALQEIKEIAEEQQSWNECNRRFAETESEADIFAYNWSALKQILQKISEVMPDEKF